MTEDIFLTNIPEKPLKSEDLIGEEINDGLEVLYVDVEHDASFSLNSTASAILELCNGERTCQEITDIICEAVDAEKSQAYQDTYAILEEFYLHKLIS